MNAVQQALYDYITASAMLPYYEQTDYAACADAWERLDGAFRAQLTEAQTTLLEQLDEALFNRQSAELEAMFLATVDQLSRLSPYFPRMAAK